MEEVGPWDVDCFSIDHASPTPCGLPSRPIGRRNLISKPWMPIRPP